MAVLFTSDCLKIYAIDYSRYFCCYKYRPKFGMKYEYTHSIKEGSQGMKALYENKAKGVCEVFAAYKSLVFDQLGITNYRCSGTNSGLNHAWCVAKVKNSEGKTLWIPFDYGIGPSENLAVPPKQRKYIDTEKKRYKLYLSVVQGAPTYKNFTDDDFN